MPFCRPESGLDHTTKSIQKSIPPKDVDTNSPELNLLNEQLFNKLKCKMDEIETLNKTITHLEEENQKLMSLFSEKKMSTLSDEAKKSLNQIKKMIGQTKKTSGRWK